MVVGEREVVGAIRLFPSHRTLVIFSAAQKQTGTPVLIYSTFNIRSPHILLRSMCSGFPDFREPNSSIL